jgi:undecaprenyl-diphosphatase
MVEFLYNLDLNTFYFINHTLSNKLFDNFFTFITEVKNWYLTYFILLILLFTKGGRRGKLSVLFVLIMITITDQLSSNFLKVLFERIRPCNALNDVNILVSCTESYSFPSSHAVNNFAVAFFFTTIFRKYRISLFTVASLIAISRAYVGVHYPSDIIGGILIGSAFGYLFGLAVLKIDSFLSSKKTKITNKYERIEFR